MALTDMEIRNAKPRPKPYKMGDSGGLFLQVTPSGGKLWRLKYRLAGKEKLLAIGATPRDESIDPAEHASYTLVGNLLLNLDETMTKE